MNEEHISYSGIFLTFFTAGLLAVTGLILLVYGFFGLLSDAGRSTEEPFHISADIWSVLQLMAGPLMLLAGINIFLGRAWARAFGIGVAGLVLLGSLLSLDTYPFFALCFIAMNVAIIWALAKHGADHVDY
jgi:hypothetical protein